MQNVRAVFNRNFMVIMVLLAFFAFNVGSSFAQSASLDIDADLFINSINSWLSMAIALVAIGVGIAGAFALARYVGRMILDAFNGKI